MAQKLRQPGADTAERVEWVLGMVCALVVLGLAAYLVRAGLDSGSTPPRLSVLAVPAPPDGLRFTVRNDGGQTAAAVALSVRLPDGSQRRLVIDYLPGRSEVTGGFVLPPPDGMPPEVVVEGYLDP
jgi:uncharacterized protein (TIGR02588 family)